MKKLIKKAFIALVVLGVAGIVCLAGVNTYMIKSTEKRILTQEEAAALGSGLHPCPGSGCPSGWKPQQHAGGPSSSRDRAV